MTGGKAPMAFLNKKGWHVTNLRNVEEVWKREMRQASEQKKIALMQKQLAEERQLEELRKLRGEGTSERLDWMYTAQGATKQTENSEDFLTGKAAPADNDGNEEVKQLESKEAAGSLFVKESEAPSSAVGNVRDMVAKLREDPMMAIKRREKEAREAVLNNPVLMARLKAELEAKNGGAGSESKHKHKHKDKHKKHKHKSKSSSKGDRKAEEGAHEAPPALPEAGGRSIQLGTGAPDGGENKRKRADPYKAYASRMASNSARSPDPSRRDRNGDFRNGEGDKRRRQWDGDSGRSDGGRDRYYRRPRSRSPARAWPSQGQSSRGHREREERQTKSGSSRMSEDERAKRLAEMQSDAAVVTHKRAQLVEKIKAAEKREEAREEREKAAMSQDERDAKFITHVGQQHMLSAGQSLQSRIASRRHYNQREDDI